MHPLEAQAILTAAEEEGANAVMISFACKSDGTLYSGHSAEMAICMAENAGASAVGINCIATDDTLSELITQLHKRVQIPLLCKPNAGRAIQGIYPVNTARFAQIMHTCITQGANLIGGCCGTGPEYIQAIRVEMQFRSSPSYSHG